MPVIHLLLNGLQPSWKSAFRLAASGAPEIINYVKVDAVKIAAAARNMVAA